MRYSCEITKMLMDLTVYFNFKYKSRKLSHIDKFLISLCMRRFLPDYNTDINNMHVMCLQWWSQKRERNYYISCVMKMQSN